MFPCRLKYIDFESDIQNNNLLYKIDQKHQNTFFKNTKNRENQKSIFFQNKSTSK